ncbi:hypothetical protein AB0C34_01645 [Nocardia sp. NPDC049220]|uniref:hypothetical protein n=1 Tax=Nocardia sp. NPDC049220 TaxID=3155273 RepID=UPI0033E1EA2B
MPDQPEDTLLGIATPDLILGAADRIRRWICRPTTGTETVRAPTTAEVTAGALARRATLRHRRELLPRTSRPSTRPG